jgi:transposase
MIYSRKELQTQYQVSRRVFYIWLKEIKGLHLKRNQRILTPEQIRKIFEHLGTPNG